MNQHWGRLNEGRGYHWAIAALLIGTFGLASCGGGSAPEETTTAPASPPAPESAPAPTTASTSAPTAASAPAAPATPAPQAAPANAPANPTASTTTGDSVFVGENFTVTITGFGIDAGYKGCDTKGQCLEIPIASSYENGSYTWENGGHLYMMQQVVGGDYRLEVRDPQGKVIVDERVNAVHNSQSKQSAPPPTASDSVVTVAGTLQSLSAGDRACYLELVDSSGNPFTELGSFEICDQTDLIGRSVRLTLEEKSFLAESCQGDLDCPDRDLLPVAMEMTALE
ncbi:MAG: hypothetical protein F6J87_20745 [Spirulina sp. SIO3F2]|nr:hypothetical protein [Spirulina sp. SIO3F2]